MSEGVRGVEEGIALLYNSPPDMDRSISTEIERAGARALVFTPLIIAAALIVYKTNASLKVLSST